MLYFQYIRCNNAKQSTDHTRNNWPTTEKAHIDRNVGTRRPRKSISRQSETDQRRNHIVSRPFVHGKRSGTGLVLQSTTKGETDKSARYDGQSDWCGQRKWYVLVAVNGRPTATLCTVARFDKAGMTSSMGRWRFRNDFSCGPTRNGRSIYGLSGRYVGCIIICCRLV